jgi:hypothetical protein
MACGIQFGTIEALTNRQILTVRDCLKKVVRLYVMRGFRVSSILADNEFEPLRQWYPALNTCAANEHVPEIEQYIPIDDLFSTSSLRAYAREHMLVN